MGLFFSVQQSPSMVRSFRNEKFSIFKILTVGWLGGAMVLGKLPEPGRPTMITVGQGPTALAVGAHFYSHLSFLFSFSLSLGDGPI